MSRFLADLQVHRCRIGPDSAQNKMSRIREPDGQDVAGVADGGRAMVPCMGFDLWNKITDPSPVFPWFCQSSSSASTFVAFRSFNQRQRYWSRVNHAVVFEDISALGAADPECCSL